MERTHKKANSEEPTNDDANEDARKRNGNCAATHMDEAPKAKMVKLDCKATTSNSTTVNNETLLDLVFNPAYLTSELTQVVKTQWNSAQKLDFKDASTDIELYKDPFQIGLLPQLLQNKQSCARLANEMIEKVRWTRNCMDLYDFYQSRDLSNMTDCKMLTIFLQMLRRNVRPWLEKVTNLKLDYVSASCSMYTCGDYLLVHDDLIKDRQIAFVYYLSPWEGNESWCEDQGGCLEIFNTNEHALPYFPVRRKISPKNNQFAFFKVGLRSFHQVGEVTTFDYPRLTINGWFHGASNEDLISNAVLPFPKLSFKQPQIRENTVQLLLNEVYLKSSTRQSIQKRIEDNSEICLYEFIRREVFEQTLEQLLKDTTLQWRLQGPASAQNFEALDLSTASKSLAQLIALFNSTEMFALLHDYTDLDLAGPNAETPTCSLEVQRWSHGNYTVCGEGGACEENTLDLIFYLNAAEGAGVITYFLTEGNEAQQTRPAGQKQKNEESDVSDTEEDEDDSVLLTVTPVDNSLNIVYRCEGTTKFTKYVSRNTPLEKGPVFIISCSYKE